MVKALFAESQRSQDGAHIARLLHDLRNREIPEWLVVVDLSPEDDDRAHLAINHFVGPGQLLLERRRYGDDLEGRTGLVDVTHGAVLQCVLACGPKGIWIECRATGQREYLARLRILHYHHARF